MAEQTPLLGRDPDQTPTPESNLSKFRKAIGINSDSKGDDLEAARKSAQGLYKEIISIQLWRNTQFRLVEGVFYTTLGTQIIIGACLAALGPLSASHSKAITILGVVNSSLAAILALLKGQNLPDRLRKDGFEMKKVQDFIEETEIRLVAMEGEDEFTAEELDKALQSVFAQYNAARDTAEINRPDSYAHQNIAGVDKRQPGNSSRSNIVSGNGPTKGKDNGAHYEIS